MYVVLDGCRGDEQAPGDLFVAQAVGDQGRDLALALGKPVQQRSRAGRHADHDHRLTEFARGLEVDGNAVADLGARRELDECLHGQHAAVGLVCGRHQLAQPSKRLGIERWNVTGQSTIPPNVMVT